MAKHTGITIRIGAAYDEVRVSRSSLNSKGERMPDIVYDRSQMRKDGHKELQGGLRRAVVDVWQEQHAYAKGKRNQRRQNKAKYNRRGQTN
jgi:hypothetical protein